VTRCPWAITFGALSTRCALPAGHAQEQHEGPGLASFPYQRLSWEPGDRREYETTRTDDSAWEEPPV